MLDEDSIRGDIPVSYVPLMKISGGRDWCRLECNGVQDRLHYGMVSVFLTERDLKYSSGMNNESNRLRVSHDKWRKGKWIMNDE